MYIENEKEKKRPRPANTAHRRPPWRIPEATRVRKTRLPIAAEPETPLAASQSSQGPKTAPANRARERGGPETPLAARKAARDQKPPPPSAADCRPPWLLRIAARDPKHTVSINKQEKKPEGEKGKERQTFPGWFAKQPGTGP